MSLVEAHEKRVSRVKMFVHMVLIGAIVAVVLYLLFLWINLRAINKNFIDAGFPETTFINYVKNKYIRIPMDSLPYLQFYTQLEPCYQEILKSKRLSVTGYNLFIDDFMGLREECRKLLETSVKKIDRYLKSFTLRFFLFLMLYILFFSFFSLLGKKQRHIRGTKLLSPFIFKWKLKWICFRDKAKNIRIGKLPIPFVNEVSHFLFMGATRSGKSVTLNQMIHSILDRKSKTGSSHKLIIYDLKGEFVSKWYTKEDILFFPFDKRSIRYSLFNEIRSDIDYKIIAKSLFEPPRNVSNNLSFFYEAGGEVFKTGLLLLNRDGKKTNKDILEFFSQDRVELIKLFKTLPKALQGPVDYLTDSREAAGVLSTIHEKINFLEYMIDCDGPFSFRNYIADENETRNLFIPNISNFKNIFMPLFSFGIDIMIKEVLSMPDDFKRRIFFLIDEFSSLNTIQSIFDFQRESGSKGGSLICAMQDLGDLSRNYGQERLQSFFNNFHTKFMFQLLDPNTQDYASRALGERQVHIRMPSHQYSPKDIGDRESVALQNTNERIVMPSEFSLLKKLHCYVQLSNLGTAQIIIPRKFFGFSQPHFDRKDFKINIEADKNESDKPRENKEARVYKIKAEKKELDRGDGFFDF
jgi:type IV secretory pathway TraG/TraD family ATPase VirD4